FEVEQRLSPRAPTPAPVPAPAPNPAAQVQAAGVATIEAQADAFVARMREAGAAEDARQIRIRRVCASDPTMETEIEEGGQKRKVAIQAHAIAAGWTPERTELEVLRCGRPNVPGGLFYSPTAPQVSDRVLEAAVLQAGDCQLFHDDFYGDDGPHGKRYIPD